LKIKDAGTILQGDGKQANVECRQPEIVLLQQYGNFNRDIDDEGTLLICPKNPVKPTTAKLL